MRRKFQSVLSGLSCDILSKKKMVNLFLNLVNDNSIINILIIILKIL